MRNSFSSFKIALALSKKGDKYDVAKRLNVTPDHVVRQLRSLEKIVGITLFEKEGNSLVTTSDGAILFSIIYACIGQLDRFILSRRSGSLRIGFTDSILANSFISPIMDHYKDHPDKNPVLTIDNYFNLMAQLNQGLIDVAVTPGNSFSVGVPIYAAGEYELNMLVSKGDPLCLTESFVTPSMAALKPLFTSEEIYRECFGDWLLQEDNTLICCNDMMYLYALTMTGSGCGIVPYCPDHNEDALPFKALPFYPPVRAPFNMFVRKDSNALARSEPFLKMLRENADRYHMIFK